jgi:hypothetical protein
MNDLDEDLRQLLARKADDVAPHGRVPRSLLVRARRRMLRNAVGVGLTVVVLAAGAVAGLRAFGSSAPQPAAATHPPSVSAPSPCTAAQLQVSASMQGAAGSREGAFVFTNTSQGTCTLEDTPTVTLLDENQDPITTGVTFSTSDPGWQVDALPTPPGWPVVTLDPGATASVRIRWSNWCPDGRAAPTWRVDVPGGGTLEVAGVDADGLPPCNGPGLPSTIEVGPFEPGNGG